MSNNIYNAFDAIHASDSLKTHTRQAVYQKLHQSGKKQHSVVKRHSFAFAACCFIFLFLGFGGYLFYTTPVAAVSIDSDLSIELKINSLNRVVSAVCYPENADNPSQKLALSHKTYQQALQDLFSDEEISSSLTEDSLLSVTVVCGNEEKSKQLQTTFSSYAQNRVRQVTCQSATKEEQQAARESGISVGKYRAFLELQSLGCPYTVEQIRQLSMREIRNLIAEYSLEDGEGSNAFEPAQSCPGQGNGYQHGNKNGSGNGNQYGRSGSSGAASE